MPDYRWPEQWLSRWYAPWRWLAAAVFHAARLLGVLASIPHIPRRRVAVIRTDGIGDAILFEPALSSLSRHCDGYELHLWAPPGVCTLMEAHPDISRFVAVPRGFKQGNFDLFWSLWLRARLGFRIGRHRYD